MAARFCEVIVDEAQDCNPADLDIIRWLKSSGIAVKVLCDPHQAIYGFRGGVTDELLAFRDEFVGNERVSLSGNFRSSPPICQAIVALRTRSERSLRDEAVGVHRDVDTAVHLLVYQGSAVTSRIADGYRDLLESHGLSPEDCPVLAATRNTAANATGRLLARDTKHLTLRLARAVTGFHADSAEGNRREALEEFHRVLIDLAGGTGSRTYAQYLLDEGLQPADWRPGAIELLRRLRYDPSVDADSPAWLARAKTLLAPHYRDPVKTISQRLRRAEELDGILASPSKTGSPARTIHSVKGLEFPSVCVVLTKNVDKVLDYLESGSPADKAEDSRKIYVAASRAQQLLAFAVPSSRHARLSDHFSSNGVTVVRVDLDQAAQPKRSP